VGHVTSAVVIDAFRDEARSLATALAGEPEAAFARPSPCTPWTVGELLWHVSNAAARIPGLLAQPEPPAGELVPAVGYYRPGPRFSDEVNADRVQTAQRSADGRTGADLLAGFERAWQATAAAVAAAPPGRRVLTRHGDVMLLTEFMRTRVLEVAVHGLDLAAGAGRPSWLTPAAAAVVEDLVLPDGTAATLREQLGWDRATLIAKVTGREPVTAAERAAADSQGLRWLALG
jgi:uncharacterized protein (TIGR03083 family)